MLELLAAVALLCGVICIHEMGHFLTARRLGIDAAEFSVGFGWRIFSRFGRRGTRYSLRLLPLGGFVSFISEADLVGCYADRASAFENQAPWKKLLIFLAGPGANLLTALLACGLMKAIDVLTVSFTAFAEGEAVMRNTSDVLLYVSYFVDAVREMFSSPQGALEVIGGPLTALMIMGGFITECGLHGLLELTAVMSVNLALFNLLPLPGLDGGQAAMALLELLRGRGLSQRWQSCYGYAALGLIGLLVIVMIGNDLWLLLQMLIPG